MNHRTANLTRTAALLVGLAALGAGQPGHADAQAQVAFASAAGSAHPAARVADEPNALEKGRYAILIDLDKNQLFFKRGNETLWSAPVGTGTGMRMITHDEDWKFTTPNGRFQVQYKEKDPVWIAPDWFFVENNLPVPSQDHPSRYMRGTLGAAALYIAPDLAIHGTDRPELIGQRVSHGCIRLENRYALRLFNAVQVGTEVIIVGGEHVEENGRTVDLRDGWDPSLGVKAKKLPTLSDPVLKIWTEQDSEDLVGILTTEFDESPRRSRWDEVAGILLDRARDGDDEAMDGLFAAMSSVSRSDTKLEYAAFLAEAYRSQPVEALEALSLLGSRDRRSTANSLVQAMVTLFAGDLDSPSTPWPTHRVSEKNVTTRGNRGWEAIKEAESEHREEILLAARTI